MTPLFSAFDTEFLCLPHPILQPPHIVNDHSLKSRIFKEISLFWRERFLIYYGNHPNPIGFYPILGGLNPPWEDFSESAPIFLQNNFISGPPNYRGSQGHFGGQFLRFTATFGIEIGLSATMFTCGAFLLFHFTTDIHKK